METATLIKLYSTTVQAGFPSPALDHMEKRIDLAKELVKHPLSTFIIEASGDSMINAFIPPQARLIVDKSLTAKNGDIVLAVVNGEFTVKFLKKNDVKCLLVPANRKYQDIKMEEGMEMQIWGVVTSIIIDANNLRKCMP